MEIPSVVYVVGIIALLVVVVVIALFAMRSRKVDLTTPESPDEKPEWLVKDPPQETMAATLADGEGITLYNYDEGEHVAAPFAEQIEDILQAQLKDNPALASTKVDLGTSSAGDLEFWVNDTKYAQIEDIPDQALQDAIHQAIERWNQYMDEEN